MTTYGKSIDLSEAPSQQGIRFSAKVGAVAVTRGQPVKYDGLTAGSVIPSTTTADLAIGVAAQTGATGDTILILGNGCRAVVPYTLTMNAKVGLGVTGTAGQLINWSSSGTVMGITETSATSASIIRIQVQW